MKNFLNKPKPDYSANIYSRDVQGLIKAIKDGAIFDKKFPVDDFKNCLNIKHEGHYPLYYVCTAENQAGSARKRTIATLKDLGAVIDYDDYLELFGAKNINNKLLGTSVKDVMNGGKILKEKIIKQDPTKILIGEARIDKNNLTQVAKGMYGLEFLEKDIFNGLNSIWKKTGKARAKVLQNQVNQYLNSEPGSTPFSSKYVVAYINYLLLSGESEELKNFLNNESAKSSMGNFIDDEEIPQKLIGVSLEDISPILDFDPDLEEKSKFLGFDINISDVKNEFIEFLPQMSLALNGLKNITDDTPSIRNSIEAIKEITILYSIAKSLNLNSEIIKGLKERIINKHVDKLANKKDKKELRIILSNLSQKLPQELSENAKTINFEHFKGKIRKSGKILTIKNRSEIKARVLDANKTKSKLVIDLLITSSSPDDHREAEKILAYSWQNKFLTEEEEEVKMFSDKLFQLPISPREKGDKDHYLASTALSLGNITMFEYLMTKGAEFNVEQFDVKTAAFFENHEGLEGKPERNNYVKNILNAMLKSKVPNVRNNFKKILESVIRNQLLSYEEIQDFADQIKTFDLSKNATPLQRSDSNNSSFVIDNPNMTNNNLDEVDDGILTNLKDLALFVAGRNNKLTPDIIGKIGEVLSYDSQNDKSSSDEEKNIKSNNRSLLIRALEVRILQNPKEFLSFKDNPNVAQMVIKQMDLIKKSIERKNYWLAHQIFVMGFDGDMTIPDVKVNTKGNLFYKAYVAIDKITPFSARVRSRQMRFRIGNVTRGYMDLLKNMRDSFVAGLKIGELNQLIIRDVATDIVSHLENHSKLKNPDQDKIVSLANYYILKSKPQKLQALLRMENVARVIERKDFELIFECAVKSKNKDMVETLVESLNENPETNLNLKKEIEIFYKVFNKDNTLKAEDISSAILERCYKIASMVDNQYAKTLLIEKSKQVLESSDLGEDKDGVTKVISAVGSVIVDIFNGKDFELLGKDIKDHHKEFLKEIISKISKKDDKKKFFAKFIIGVLRDNMESAPIDYKRFEEYIAKDHDVEKKLKELFPKLASENNSGDSKRDSSQLKLSQKKLCDICNSLLMLIKDGQEINEESLLRFAGFYDPLSERPGSSISGHSSEKSNRLSQKSISTGSEM